MCRRRPPRRPLATRRCVPAELFFTPRSSGFARKAISGEGRTAHHARIARFGRAEDLDAALTELGFPAVLKTAAFGYDGKGQFNIDSCGARRRGVGGDAAAGGGAGGVHRFRVRDFGSGRARRRTASSCILAPSKTSTRDTFWMSRSHRREYRPRSRTQAVEMARAVLDELDVVGVLCVEFFVTRDGQTADQRTGAASAQLGTSDRRRVRDQPVRATTARGVRAAVGIDAMHRPAAMANLLGDVWSQGEPDWAAACGVPGCEAASVRQAGAAARAEDGASDGAESRFGCGIPDGGGSAAKFGGIKSENR